MVENTKFVLFRYLLVSYVLKKISNQIWKSSKLHPNDSSDGKTFVFLV